MTPLRQRMTEDLQLRNLGPHTQRAYLQYVSQFAGHFHKSPELLGPAEIRAFQLYLNRNRQLAAGSVGSPSPLFAFSTRSRSGGDGTPMTSSRPAVEDRHCPLY